MVTDFFKKKQIFKTQSCQYLLVVMFGEKV